ncbi:MAG TPA: ABC transporter substrate-binding protein [Candidatus Baltobacteraceae bacterium]
MLPRSRFLAGACGIALMLPARATAAAKVVIQYDWLMSNGQIGDVVALKRGFFRDAGLDVELSPGGPNATAAAPVISGHAQLGQLSDSGQVMFARNSGIPIKIIAAGLRVAPFAFYSLPKNPIRSPHDMIGKRIGIQPTARYVLEAILAKNAIDPAKVAVTDVGADMTPLAAGRVDAITGWITNAKEMSIFSGPLVSLSMESAGLPSYGDTYFATDDAIAKSSDQLARFIRALAQGWDWTYQYPSDAVDIAAAEYPELDSSVEKRIMPTVLRLTFDKDTARDGWGTFRPERLAAQMRAYAAVGLLKNSLRVEDVYSMKILRDTVRAKRG